MSRDDLKEAISASAMKRARLEIELETLMKQAENPCMNGDDAESGDLSSEIERCKGKIALCEKEMDTLLQRYTDDANARWYSEWCVMGDLRSTFEAECVRMAVWLRTHYEEAGNKLERLWDLYQADNPGAFL